MPLRRWCIYAHVHVCMYVGPYASGIFMHMCMRACMWAHVQVVYLCTCACVHICGPMRKWCIYAHVHACMYVGPCASGVFMHMCVCAFTWAHVPLCKHVNRCLPMWAYVSYEENNIFEKNLLAQKLKTSNNLNSSPLIF